MLTSAYYHHKCIGRNGFTYEINEIQSRLPIIAWLPTYNWQEDLLRDVINGIMISIIYIPQGYSHPFQFNPF